MPFSLENPVPEVCALFSCIFCLFAVLADVLVSEKDALFYCSKGFSMFVSLPPLPEEKATGALTSLHGSLFPKGQPPASLGELAELFVPDGSAIDDFRREHTIRGSPTTLLMLLGHSFEGDFDMAMSGLPRGPDGKPVLHPRPGNAFSARPELVKAEWGHPEHNCLLSG